MMQTELKSWDVSSQNAAFDTVIYLHAEAQKAWKYV